MALTAKILIVDDEKAIRLTFQEFLASEGYQVTTAESGQTALELIAAQSFDLVLLDLKLGDTDGLDILTKLQQLSPDTLVIMLTAYASLETAVEALRRGAHDYLIKPCPVAEVRNSIGRGLLKLQGERRQRQLLCELEERISTDLATIRTVMDGQMCLSDTSCTSEQSRPNPLISIADSIADNGCIFSHGELSVDVSRHLITLSGQPLPLTTTEFSLLTYLIRQTPQTVSPEELVRQVLGYDTDSWEAGEIVRAHISNIRRKIKEVGGRTTLIDTVRGQGYTIRAL